MVATRSIEPSTVTYAALADRLLFTDPSYHCFCQPQPGDDTYSGMHDQGPLPEMKEGGPMALLIGCVDAAKTFNNDFLTTAIQTEKLRKALSEQQQEAVPLKKKTKTEDEASSG